MTMPLEKRMSSSIARTKLSELSAGETARVQSKKNPEHSGLVKVMETSQYGAVVAPLTDQGIRYVAPKQYVPDEEVIILEVNGEPLF